MQTGLEKPAERTSAACPAAAQVDGAGAALVCKPDHFRIISDHRERMEESTTYPGENSLDVSDVADSLTIGLFGVGLDTYWAQFDGLKDRLDGYLRIVEEKLTALHPRCH